MFGIFDEIARGIGAIVGTVCGVPIGVLAVTLGLSEEVVQAAVKAGCATKEEIKDFARNL